MGFMDFFFKLSFLKLRGEGPKWFETEGGPKVEGGGLKVEGRRGPFCMLCNEMLHVMPTSAVEVHKQKSSKIFPIL